MAIDLVIPPRLLDVFAKFPNSKHGAALTNLCTAAKHVFRDKPDFFPEYTNHDGCHVNEILDTVDRLIPREALDAREFDDANAACLVASVILHDYGEDEDGAPRA